VTPFGRDRRARAWCRRKTADYIVWLAGDEEWGLVTLVGCKACSAVFNSASIERDRNATLDRSQINRRHRQY
jgi:hypothetical protein